MRSATLDLVFLTTLAAGLVYFSVDAWLGASGGSNRAPLRAEISEIQREIDDLTRRHEALEAKTQRLSGLPASSEDASGDPNAPTPTPEIDPELLDERLRATLGVMAEDEVLLIEPGEAQTPR
ncbi:MAG: hypothetical protein AAFW46_11730 [Pseudomonadota bacterium]